jgi:CubicO group peptidase (beta-lactamase class C family)
MYVAALLVVVAASGCAQEQVTFPNTKAGKLMGEWLNLVNGGEREALTKFVAENYAPENLKGRPAGQVADGQLDFAASMHGLELQKVQESTEVELRVVLSGHTAFPSLVTGMYQVDPKSGKIVRSMFKPASGAESAAKKVPLVELEKDLDARLEKATAADEFSGAVLIAKDGKPLWQKAYGFADRAAKVKNTVDTRFRIGSMSKMFTSVAIAQLVEAGKLKYTDTIADALPDYPDQDLAKKITIAELLTHTSGLGDIFGPEFEQKKDSLRTEKDYLSLFAGKPLQFEPGKGWSYSNAGFVVLGLIVERVSGQSYYDYVKQHVFDVAGMKSTGDTPKDKASKVAIGYMHAPDGKLVNNYDTLPMRNSSAGGGESTVGDLMRFANALRRYKLVNQKLTDEITRGKVSPLQPEPQNMYAYGFEDHGEAGPRIVGHGGGAPGMNGILQIYWDKGYTVVVLANVDPRAAEGVADYIRGRLE